MKKYKHKVATAVIIIISISYSQPEVTSAASLPIASSKLSSAPALRKPTAPKATFFRARQLKNGARIVWQKKCWFNNSNDIKTHCAHYYPPVKNKTHPPHRIPIVYFQTKKQLDPEPILYISGGPGYSTGLRQKNIPGWIRWINEAKWGHDLVFFDQRGTGLSKPSIACPNLIETNIKQLAANISPQQESISWQKFSQRCFDLLTKKGLDLNQYTTLSTVEDIKNIIQLIKAKQWNIYAVSYGTRVALQLLKEDNALIKAVILDSVYPTDINELIVVPELMAYSFKKLLATCRLKYFCGKFAPNLEKNISQMVKKLNSKPYVFKVRPENYNKEITVTINGYRFAWMLYMSMYHWDLIEKMPAAIATAAKHGPAALKPMVIKYAQWSLDKTFSPAAYYSVECHDRDKIVSKEMYQTEVDKYPYVKQFVDFQWQYDVCKFWKSGRAPKEFFQPTKSSAPILLLNGELDPVTPWYWAARVAKELKNGYFIKIPGVGHGAVDSDQCATKIAIAFFNTPHKRPTLDCEQKWHQPDFKFDKKALN